MWESEQASQTIPLMLHRRTSLQFVFTFQTDSGCAVPTPSLHCQRIARAKWEFLFGTPAEEAASRGEKSESSSQFNLLTALSCYARVEVSFLWLHYLHISLWSKGEAACQFHCVSFKATYISFCAINGAAYHLKADISYSSVSQSFYPMREAWKWTQNSVQIYHALFPKVLQVLKTVFKKKNHQYHLLK